jgi:anti-anti-sigma factor
MGIVVVFAGEYDVACKVQFREELSRLKTQGDVVLDFSDVTYIDSTIIAELLLLAKDRIYSGLQPQTIVLSNNSGVKRIFELVRLGKVITIVDSLERANRNGAADVRYAFSSRSEDFQL